MDYYNDVIEEFKVLVHGEKRLALTVIDLEPYDYISDYIIQLLYIYIALLYRPNKYIRLKKKCRFFLCYCSLPKHILES